MEQPVTHRYLSDTAQARRCGGYDRRRLLHDRRAWSHRSDESAEPSSPDESPQRVAGETLAERRRQPKRESIITSECPSIRHKARDALHGTPERNNRDAWCESPTIRGAERQ